MAKVFGIHELELKPGASAEEFERFVLEDVGDLPAVAGMHTYLLKGDRGSRIGKYVFLFEFENEEARDRAAPSEHRHGIFDLEAVQNVFERWGTFATVPGEEMVSTDYVVVS